MAMILENFQKTFDTDKMVRLLGAKTKSQLSLASQQRIDVLTEEIGEMLAPQLSYRTLELAKINRGDIFLSNGTCFKSPRLAKALSKAESACFFLATIGPAVEIKVAGLMEQRRYADAYILDAMGSTAAENIVEQFYQRMAKRQHENHGAVTLRFSPGYCDWPIEQQRQLFDLFADIETPDIELTESCLMVPKKSVSGLFGLLGPGIKGADPAYNPCDTCPKRDCIARR